MNVKEFLDIITNEVNEEDRENAQIEIWCDEQEYEIDSMGGFSLSPDIVIRLKPTTSPIMKKATFKKEHQAMVEERMAEIKKEIEEERKRNEEDS